MISKYAARFAIIATVLPLTAAAQSQERSPAFDLLSADTSEWIVPKNTVSFGFRVLTSGPTADFSNLGNVPSIRTIAPASAGDVDRIYDNGAVAKDAARATEKDANGNQTSTPGGRYQTSTTDANGNVTQTGDFLSYTPGQTRNWSYRRADQLSTPGSVAFNTFSARSEGATASADQGLTAGVDVQLARAIGKIGKRAEWSMIAGVALSDISIKTGGKVTSSLVTTTDLYSLNGATAPGAPYIGPSFVDFTRPDGTVVTQLGRETTVPLGTLPTSSTTSTTAGGASVLGNWQIKGAYFMMKLGPSVRAQLTQRLGMSASAGVAGAYAGSRYSVVETIELPDVTDPITATESATESKFLGGFYADLNLEWTANERTGLFGGVSVQQFGDYDQSVGGRSARIDLGNAVGFRGGVNIRF